MRSDQPQVNGLAELKHGEHLAIFEVVAWRQVLLDLTHGNFEEVASRLILL